MRQALASVSRPPDSAAVERPVGVAVATPFLPELESLRGIAMVVVFAFHLNSNLRYPFSYTVGEWVSPAAAFMRAGHSGVDLFFILSGFLLSLPFLSQSAGGRRVAVSRYFVRRALRILPLYYAAVLCATLLSAADLSQLWRGIPYLFFLNSVGDGATPLPPYSNVWWSLGTEAQFYLVLPLLPLAFGSRRRELGAMLIFALWAAAYLSFVTRTLRGDTIAEQITLGVSLLARAPMFLAGIAAAWVYLHHGVSLRRRLAGLSALRNGGADLGLLAILAALAYVLRWVVWLGPQREMSPEYQIWHLPETVLWTAFILLMLLAPLRLKPLLSNSILSRLGVLSYSIYIVHVPVMVFGRIALREQWPGLSGNMQWLAFAPFICLATVALAEVTYRWIEQPFLRRKEQWRA